MLPGYKELAETYIMRKASLLSVEKCAKGRPHESTRLLTNEFLVFRIDSEVSEADSGRASDDVDGDVRWRQHVNDDR